jgi:hypothetical protein
MTTITILQSASNSALTKVHTRKLDKDGNPTNTVATTPFSKEAWFNVSAEPVANIEQLAAVLSDLKDEPSKMVVRGSPRDNVRSTRIKRTKYKPASKTGNFLEVDQSWVMLDIDKMPLEVVGISTETLKQSSFDWGKLAKILVGFLPSEFRDASFVYQLSSSQNIGKKDSISMHLWFWLDMETSDKDLKDYFSVINSSMRDQYGVDGFVDLALFNCVQPHYTANPIFINMDDVLGAPRVALVKGKRDAVTISTSFIRQDPKVSGRFLERLQELGGSDGFNSVLHTAAWTFVAEYGDAPEARRQFIDAAQAQIAQTNPGKRSKEEIARYASHEYLSNVLQSAIDKGAGKGVITGTAIEFFEDFYYIANLSEFFCISAHEMITEKAFDALAQAKLKHKGMVSVFLQNMEDRVVHGEIYYPDSTLRPLETFKYNGSQYFNSWPGRSCEAAGGEDNISFINDHLLFLSGADPEVAQQLSWFLAHTIRFPGEKVAWAPLLISDYQGVGKTLLSLMYSSVGFGSRTIAKVDGGMVAASAFNSFAYGHEICFIDEVEQAHRTQSAGEILKSLIGTDEPIELNEKYRRNRVVPNRTNYILTSNKRDAVSLDPEARRYLVALCEERAKPFEYYERLSAILKDGAQVMAWAESIDLKEFNRHARPKRTAAQIEVEERSAAPWIKILDNAFEGDTYPLHHPSIALADLVHTMQVEYRISLSQKQLSKYLKDKGYFLVDQIHWQGKRLRLWLNPNKNLQKARARITT